MTDPLVVVGASSGTSADGIDVAAAHIDRRGDELLLRPLGHDTTGFTGGLREQLRRALPPARIDAETVARLDTAVGRQVGGAVVSAIRRFCPDGADLVASHGQTLFHWVEHGTAMGTLQVGQPAWVAEATGLPVVSDLRARDVAAGGQGAPLASTLDVLLLGGHGRCPAALNIGGIANLTVVPQNGPPVAFDSGPGNALLDAAAVHLGLEKGYDDGGRLASTGRVDAGLLESLLSEPYYEAEPPKSTGKEYFNGDYLRRAVAGRDLSPADLLATLAELSAQTVARSCRAYDCDAVFASGGGVRNRTLMDRLASLIRPARLAGSDELGLPADGKEAYLFAVLGYLTWHGIPGTVPECTGARHASVLGSVTPGATPLRLPPPVSVRPSRLRVVTSRDR